MKDYIVDTASATTKEFKRQIASMRKLAEKNNIDAESLNAIITDFDALSLTFLTHLTDQIMLPLN